jgi:DNA polymerase-3 subunit beta
MRGIGEMARASGLSVSALRFYDSAGVLVPASVDPATGYRRYADDQLRAARLIAGLRRVGMPLADLTRAVQDPFSVRRLLDQHLRRLTDGLADARREIARIHALLDLEEPAMTRATLPSAALAAALDAVRFAAGHDPELPALATVLVETAGDTLTLVSTDRYRLAVAETAAAVEGPPARLLLPVDLVDEVRPLLGGDDPVTVALDDQRVVFGTAGRRVEGVPFDEAYPDYRRLTAGLGREARRVTVDVAALRVAAGGAEPVWRELDGAPFPIVILTVDRAGTLRLAAEADWAADAAAHVAVNREFLLQALDAGGAGQLVLELDGPIKPLAVRAPGSFSLLMPVRQ